MSRNFELLQKLGRESEIFSPAYGATTAAPVAAVDLGDITPPQFDLDPPQRDEVTKLVQRIFLAAGPEMARAVIFCGLEGGGDSGWICAHAAQILAAQVSRRVCVVDANLREPGLHKHFGLEPDLGLTDALQHSDPIRNFMRPTGRPNLSLLSAGSDSQQWETLLGSDRMRSRIAELRSEVDYLLVDAPALNVSSDVAALGRASDGVVLVLRANTSTPELYLLQKRRVCSA